MKKEDLLFSLGELDDSVIADAKPRDRKKIITRGLTVAACLVLAVGITFVSIALFGNPSGGDGPIGEAPGGPSAEAPEGNDPGMGDTPGTDIPDMGEDPDIGGSTDTPEDPFSDYTSGENFYRLISIINRFNKNDNTITQDRVDVRPQPPQPDAGDDLIQPEQGTNGGYINVTENQVSGVEEPDKLKMTDKYLFYLGDKQDARGEALYIYTLEGENSREVCYYPLPIFDGSPYSDETNKIFLSHDASAIYIIKNYRGKDDLSGIYKTTITLLDITDVSAPKEIKHITLGGHTDFVRMVNGRLLVGTTFHSTKYQYDWADPHVYLPYYEVEGTKTLFDPKDVICPDELNYRSYSSVFILDEELSVISNKAVFGVSGVYGEYFVSDDKIVYSLGHGVSSESSVGGSAECKSDIVVIDYTPDSIKVRNIFEADGWIMDRFFIDEKDGFLRFVTNSYRYNWWNLLGHSSSLYIYDLNKGEYVASVVDFAPEGEGATAVRFEGDNCYVCTAEIKTHTDPVYFFDLSDYSNITQVNTGFIDGFSTNLIDYGDGYLLGIGEIDFRKGKVSIYKREGDAVITVADYFFDGNYVADRRAYLIDRENGLFGFFSGSTGSTSGTYHLLKIDGEELVEIYSESISYGGFELRSVYYKEHLYILEVYDLTVKKIIID